MRADGRAKVASRAENENMWHFRDWRRNVSLDEERNRAKPQDGEEDQRGMYSSVDIGCPVPHEACIQQGAWVISVKSLGNTIPNINAQRNKKSVGPVNRKLAD
jgi:hypothetical protein